MSPDAAQSQRFDRHYRIPVTGVWIGRTLMVLYALCAVPFLLSSPYVVVGIALLASVVVIAAWMERLFRRGGIRETDAGLSIMAGWRSKTIRWEHIAAFRQSRTVPRSRVLIIGMNGAVEPIVGTSQGARVRWRDGETHDIVGVLNTRLEEWRAAHPPATR